MQELNAAKPIVQNPKVLETLSILFKLRLYQLNVALNMSACTTFVRVGRSAIEYTRVGEYSRTPSTTIIANVFYGRSVNWSSVIRWQLEW